MVKCPKCGLEGTPVAEVKRSNVYYRVEHYTGEGRKVCYLGPAKYKVDRRREGVGEEEMLLAEYVALTKAVAYLVEDTVLALRRPPTLRGERDKKLVELSPRLKAELESVHRELTNALRTLESL